MALSITEVTRANLDTDGTSFTTGSVSPTANARLLLWILAHDASSAPEAPSSITGTNWANGLTWTSVASVDVANGDDGGVAKLQVYTAVAPGSVTAGTVTGTFSATHEKFQWYLVQCTDTATPEVVQSKTNSGTGDITATLDSAPETTNGSVAFGSSAENSTVTFAPGLTNLNTILGEASTPQWVTRAAYSTSSPPTGATADVSAGTDNTGVIYIEVGQPVSSFQAAWALQANQ